MKILETDPGIKGVESDQIDSYIANATVHRPGITTEEVVENYSNWKSNYEKDLNPDIYRGPQLAADFCNIMCGNKKSRIIDIGAGTGFVGEYLRKHGFDNIDALEPSGLADVAKTKNIYKNIIRELISDQTPTSIPEGTYDMVVLSGAFGEGHIPSGGIRELARICRTGGHVIIVMREEYLEYVSEYKDRLEPLMETMVTENVWKRVLRFQVQDYSFRKNGIIFIFQKL